MSWVTARISEDMKQELERIAEEERHTVTQRVYD